MTELNIKKHELVAKHEILKEEEKEMVLQKYGITLKQLPRILVTDPQIKVLEGKIGDVVKITRMSQSAGEAVYYRVVVKG